MVDHPVCLLLKRIVRKGENGLTYPQVNHCCDVSLQLSSRMSLSGYSLAPFHVNTACSSCQPSLMILLHSFTLIIIVDLAGVSNFSMCLHLHRIPELLALHVILSH